MAYIYNDERDRHYLAWLDEVSRAVDAALGDDVEIIGASTRDVVLLVLACLFRVNLEGGYIADDN